MKYFLIILLFISAKFYSQEKYLIYFKDKGIKSNQAVLKTSNEYLIAKKILSDRAIQRRIKTCGEDNLITYEDLQLNENYINSLEKIGIKIFHKLKWLNAISAYLTNEQINKISFFPFIQKIDKVKKFSFKKFDESKLINQKINLANSFTVHQNSLQYNYGFSFHQLNLSDIPLVHNNGITGKDVLIGILDTGFDWKKHDALKNSNVITEYDFVFKDSVTSNQPGDSPSQDSHGTYVFSILGGFKDSSLIGSSFNSKFILAKTEDVRSETQIEEDNFASALEWMENLGVDITSSSLGYNIFDNGLSYSYKDMDGKTTIVTKAAEIAFNKGVVVITAAGNEGAGSWYYIIAPADGKNTIAVGAVDFQNSIASFSSRGPASDGRIKPDVVAMGVSNYGASAHSTNQYQFNSGTSAATPIVSGVAGLLLSAYSHLTNKQVRNILLETSDNYLTPDNQVGNGLVSALKAITFPNISYIQEICRINKIFFNKIISGSAKINYSINGTDYYQTSLTSTSNYYYVGLIPNQNAGQLINFYITYKDSLNNEIREPSSNGNYYFYFNEFNVYSNFSSLSQKFDLRQNYPNPFNNLTTIEFYSNKNAYAELNIHNINGEKIKNIYAGVISRGLNTFFWNGKNDKGNLVSSGIYFYAIKIEDEKVIRKMILLK